MRISDNFKMKEFEVSASFPYLVEPVPQKYQHNVIDLVLFILQPICDATGWRDYISSGYRPARLNLAVNGSHTSQHMKAQACDNNFYFLKDKVNIEVSPFEVAGKTIELGLDFDQMILYNTFVHFSYARGKNRMQLLYNSSYNGKRL